MKKSLFILVILALLSIKGTVAKWYIDQQYKFKINVPDNWSAKSYMEGTDKVYDFTSHDENVAIQLRAFNAEKGISAELIAEVFDEELQSQGGSKLSLADDELNGLPGKLGVYKNIYNGKEVALVTFSAVKGDVGYLFLIIIPVSLFDQKMKETDAILNTFTILEDNNQIAQEEKLKDPGGLSGDKTDNQQTAPNSQVYLGTTLPAGKVWPEGVWPQGKYNCGEKMFLGVIGLNDSHVSWTGDNYIFRPNFYLPKGDATWKTELFCPNHENWCRIKAKHTWKDSNGEYIIETTFPQGMGMKDRVHMKVHTTSTGWIDVYCTKIE